MSVFWHAFVITLVVANAAMFIGAAAVEVARHTSPTNGALWCAVMLLILSLIVASVISYGH